MNIEKELSKLLKAVEGRILLIGLGGNNFNKIILNNDKILSCDIFCLNSASSSKKKSKGEINQSFDREIALRDIHKEYKKKDLDYIFCDIEVIKKEINYFIKNSLYLCHNRIFIYGNIVDYDIETLVERYEKYGIKINIKEKDGIYILEVIVGEEYKRIKSKWYFHLYNTIDTLNRIVDSAGDMMTR